ncbi:DUF6463 family protein [Pseudonocardia phyllosphaerae]|uniref:DUF6463 family protein n=1 Tax=Pseudonocardia phyllosphaerae TaxID=3390502 RepID=UPI00397C4880
MGSDSTRRRYLTAAGGWLAVVFGAVHVVAAPLAHRAELERARDDGWWSTFTLDEPTTLDTARRSDAFWRTLGSFGVPVLTFGAHVVWSVQRGQRVPAWLGWGFLVWSLPFVTALPRSPSWTVPAIGALIAAGDRGMPGPSWTADR